MVTLIKAVSPFPPTLPSSFLTPFLSLSPSHSPFLLPHTIPAPFYLQLSLPPSSHHSCPFLPPTLPSSFLTPSLPPTLSSSLSSLSPFSLSPPSLPPSLQCLLPYSLTQWHWVCPTPSLHTHHATLSEVRECPTRQSKIIHV